MTTKSVHICNALVSSFDIINNFQNQLLRVHSWATNAGTESNQSKVNKEVDRDRKVVDDGRLHTYTTMYVMMTACSERLMTPTFLLWMCTIFGVSYSIKAASADDRPDRMAALADDDAEAPAICRNGDLKFGSSALSTNSSAMADGKSHAWYGCFAETNSVKQATLWRWGPCSVISHSSSCHRHKHYHQHNIAGRVSYAACSCINRHPLL